MKLLYTFLATLLLASSIIIGCRKADTISPENDMTAKTISFGNESAQHQEMASNYVSVIRDVLKAYNTSISDDIATAISWGGLQNTDSWYLLGNDTTSIINKNNQARDNNASLLLTNCK